MKYVWNAEDYAGNSLAQFRWAEEMIGKLELTGHESVLDIGCGDGKVTARIAEAVPNGRVIGIDSSESMVRFASDHFPEDVYPNLSFRCMDATQIDLPERFDIVFSNASLHWIRDQGLVLRGVRSCLKPRGRIMFQMGGQGNAAEVLEMIQGIAQYPQWRKYFAHFTMPYFFQGPGEYRAFLIENGFDPLGVRLYPRDMEHLGREAFHGWLRTTWFPYTDCLPEHLREVFLREVIDRYLDSHPADANGNVHVKMVRLEVDAVVVTR